MSDPVLKSQNQSPQEENRYKEKGRRALVLNILFFVVLFLGMFLVPAVGLSTAVIIISAFFVISMLYIYYS